MCANALACAGRPNVNFFRAVNFSASLAPPHHTLSSTVQTLNFPITQGVMDVSVLSPSPSAVPFIPTVMSRIETSTHQIQGEGISQA